MTTIKILLTDYFCCSDPIHKLYTITPLEQNTDALLKKIDEIDDNKHFNIRDLKDLIKSYEFEYNVPYQEADIHFCYRCC